MPQDYTYINFKKKKIQSKKKKRQAIGSMNFCQPELKREAKTSGKRRKKL